MQTAVLIQRKEKPALPNSSTSFDEKLGATLFAETIDTLQVNVGKLCNQACKHCHVDASPIRTEIMRREVVDACLKILRDFQIPTLDITGGAPELIPDFRYFVTEARKTGAKIIVRHNLTVMFEENQTDLPEFLRRTNAKSCAACRIFWRRRLTRSAEQKFLINQSRR